MRAVLDTNVLVSGILTPAGNCARILDLTLEGVVELHVDGRILKEYGSVLRRPELGLSPREVDEVLGFIRIHAYQVTPLPVPARLPDPGDLPFLEVALHAGVLLVTGNRRHFPPSECGPARVITPKEFLDLLRLEKPPD